jgi:hypothetical protein
LNLCDDLVNGKFEGIPEDATPHDILLSTAQLGLNIRPGLEPFLDELLDSGEIQLDVVRHKHFRRGFGFAANIFAGFDQHENPYELYEARNREISETLHKERPKDEDWDKFLKSLEQ